MEKINNSKNFFIRNLPIILAFFLTTLALSVMFAFKGMYPFGQYMYMRSDSYHQYCTFLREFQRILKEGGSLAYTWKIGLGSGLPATYAYYLATPVYWLVAILPSEHIPEIMGGFIIIKAGLMASTMAFYLKKHFGKASWLTCVFGMFYAMSSYMAAYSWNSMWLDCLLLLPLVILGLERLVKEKKVMLYTISLSVAIYSNYYIAIMICIFLVLYFLYLVLCEPTGRKFKGFLGDVGRFALFSILAALMAAACWFCAFSALSGTASGEFSFPSKMRVYFNFLEMISRSVMLVEPTVLSGYFPNIYCSISLFLFVPLYWISSKIDYRQRIGKTILMAFMLISFGVNILTYVWHGFHFPNSLSSRESFLYIFLVLAMAYEALSKIDKFSYREIMITYGCGLIGIFGLQYMFDSDTYTMTYALVNAGFLTLFAGCAVLIKQNKLKNALIVIAVLALTCAECAINTSVTGYPTTNRTNYYKDNEDISKLLDMAEDEDGFYRVEKVLRRTKNDACWHDYMGASEFSSTTLAGISDFYDSFGMQSSTNSFSYYGHTPVSTAVLGVRYELAKEEQTDPLMSIIGQSGGEYFYENKYALGLGYTVQKSLKDGADMQNSNPFTVQNSFLENACSVENVFTVGGKTNGSSVKLTAKQDGRQFVFITNKLEAAEVTVTRYGETVLTKEFDSLENPQIIDIGDVKKNDSITVVSKDDEVKNISLYSAIMTYEKLDEAMNALGKNQLVLTTFDDDHLVGKITADEDCYMFTSIPYDTGWGISVDGQKVEYTDFYNAFIMVPLTAGEHIVEFNYAPQGLYIGIVISCLAILAFVLITLTRRGIRINREAKARENI